MGELNEECEGMNTWRDDLQKLFAFSRGVPGSFRTSVRRVSTRVCSADFWPVRRVASRNSCINSSPRVGSPSLIMWP
jgi:hypothetical protein